MSHLSTDLSHLHLALSSVLETLFDEPTLDAAAADVTFSLAAAVNVVGEDHALIVVCVDDVIARTYAAEMFGTTFEDVTDNDVVDSLLELTNVLGGAAKTALAGQSHLTLPGITPLDAAVAKLEHGVVFNVAGGSVGIAITEVSAP